MKLNTDSLLQIFKNLYKYRYILQKFRTNIKSLKMFSVAKDMLQFFKCSYYLKINHTAIEQSTFNEPTKIAIN